MPSRHQEKDQGPGPGTTSSSRVLLRLLPLARDRDDLRWTDERRALQRVDLRPVRPYRERPRGAAHLDDGRGARASAPLLRSLRAGAPARDGGQARPRALVRRGRPVT
ncbi:hypothetical protein NOCARDAX2BIS_150087 [Nocardioides sp. AX2bis]|nr:hypothetical protein NOCARDAX2BIS_150087 [Nocardioides sp. AX2bis]